MAIRGIGKKKSFAVLIAAILVFALPLLSQEYDEDSPVELIENDDTRSEAAETEAETKVTPKKQKKNLKKKKVSAKSKKKKAESDAAEKITKDKKKEPTEKEPPGDDESIAEVSAFQAAPEHPDFLYDTRSIPGLKDFDSAWAKSSSDKTGSATEVVPEKTAPAKPTEFKFKMPDINLTQILVIGGAILLFILYQIQIRKKMRNRR